MNIVSVPLKQNGYDIVIGSGILADLGARLERMRIGRDAVVITHPSILRLHGKGLVKGLKKAGISVKVLTVPSGEKSKSCQTAFSLMEKIATEVFTSEEIVIAVHVNGKPLNDDSLAASDEKPLAEINEISIKTEKDPKEFAVKLLTQVSDYLSQLSPGLCEVADTLRAGNVEQANTLLVQALDGLVLFTELIGTIKNLSGFDDSSIEIEGETLSSLEERLTEILKNIQSGQESEDWVTVADLLEYELATILQEWRDIIPSIQRCFTKSDS